MNPVEKITSAESPAVRRLDEVRMSEAKRALAKQQMRQAEGAVDLIFALARVLHSAAGRWTGRLFPSADRQRETYLAEAVDRVDLEHRIRALERRRSWTPSGL